MPRHPMIATFRTAQSGSAPLDPLSRRHESDDSGRGREERYIDRASDDTLGCPSQMLLNCSATNHPGEPPHDQLADLGFPLAQSWWDPAPLGKCRVRRLFPLKDLILPEKFNRGCSRVLPALGSAGESTRKGRGHPDKLERHR